MASARSVHHADYADDYAAIQKALIDKELRDPLQLCESLDIADREYRRVTQSGNERRSNDSLSRRRGTECGTLVAAVGRGPTATRP